VGGFSFEGIEEIPGGEFVTAFACSRLVGRIRPFVVGESGSMLAAYLAASEWALLVSLAAYLAGEKENIEGEPIRAAFASFMPWAWRFPEIAAAAAGSASGALPSLAVAEGTPGPDVYREAMWIVDLGLRYYLAESRVEVGDVTFDEQTFVDAIDARDYEQLHGLIGGVRLIVP
jgi:hypothetical protein